MGKKNLYLVGFGTLFGFGILGLVVIYFFIDEYLLKYLLKGIPWYYQLLVGLFYGTTAGYFGHLIIQAQFMEAVKANYTELIQGLDVNRFEIIFLSFSAGVGEELFFRGALQPFLGIWIAAIFFVAIHGYLNPKNWRLSFYGVMMTIIIAGMGWMFQEIGIFAAMSAHFAIDVVLFSVASKKRNISISNINIQTTNSTTNEVI